MYGKREECATTAPDTRSASHLVNWRCRFIVSFTLSLHKTKLKLNARNRTLYYFTENMYINIYCLRFCTNCLFSDPDSYFTWMSIDGIALILFSFSHFFCLCVCITCFVTAINVIPISNFFNESFTSPFDIETVFAWAWNMKYDLYTTKWTLSPKLCPDVPVDFYYIKVLH